MPCLLALPGRSTSCHPLQMIVFPVLLVLIVCRRSCCCRDWLDKTRRPAF